MSKTLIIGGAGYVGSVLAEELLARGRSVRILDRLYFGRAGLKRVADRVELVAADMRSIPDSAFDDVDNVVNLGGLSNDPTAEYNPEANYQMNTVATRTSAEACKARGIERYVFSSTCSIYDRGIVDESRDVLLDETAEVNPKAAYSRSKLDAEDILKSLADDSFCPVILRKGTIYGFSPRMRYDLVVNTFVKDALKRGFVTLHIGGEMWRPLVDVRDVARAYVAALDADAKDVRGEIFNVSARNFRISEVALRVKEALRPLNIDVDLRADYKYSGVRNYRVQSNKLKEVLGVEPKVSIEESATTMVEQIREFGYTDFDHPRYYNIAWMKALEEAENVISITGSVFNAEHQEPALRTVRAGAA